MRYLGSNILVSPENRTHGTLVLSAAIIAACDSANTSRDLYPMAYTSTLADDFSGVIAHRYTSGTCVVNATHFAVGAFLSSGIELQSDMLFAVSCSASFVPASGSTAIVSRPFFGRTVNSSVTVSTAAALTSCNESIISFLTESEEILTAPMSVLMVIFFVVVPLSTVIIRSVASTVASTGKLDTF